MRRVSQLYVLRTIRMFAAAIVLQILILFSFHLAANAQELEAIRFGDYVNYTHICFEISKEYSQAHVIPGEGPSIHVRLFGVSPGGLSGAQRFDSHAFQQKRVSHSAGWLVIDIPLQRHVDLSQLHWHKWQNMLTVDIPYIVPIYRDYPTPRQIDEFKLRGGKVVIIDPGHGGFDMGAVAGRTIPAPRLRESDVVLDMAKRLKARLDRDPEFMAVLTRTDNYLPVPMGLTGTTRRAYLNASLLHRVRLAHEFRGNIKLSLHLNAHTNTNARGYEIYYLGDHHAQELYDSNNLDIQQLAVLGIDKSNEGNALISSVRRDNVPKFSKLLAASVTDQIGQVSGMVLRPRTMLPHRFLVLRQFQLPSVLVEYLFISNPNDHRFISSAQNRDRLVEATYRGIRNYFYPADSGVLPEFNLEDLIAAGQTTSPPVASAPRAIQQTAVTAAAPSPQPRPQAQPQTQPQTQVRPQQQPQPQPQPQAQSQTSLTADRASQNQSIPQTYIVRRGDSLGAISQRFGVDMNTLRELNRGKIGRNDVIHPGQELTIKPAEPLSPSSNTVTYTVRSGDTLESIANRHNTTIASLRSMNNLRGSLIYPGQELKVDRGSGAVASAPLPLLYVVKRGDTLSGIASRHGTTTQEIMRSNQLRNATIRPGQELKIHN